MESLANEKTMTVKEVSEALGVSRDTTERAIKYLYPDKMKKGSTTYLNDIEVTEIKVEIYKKRGLINLRNAAEVTTKLERNQTVLKAMQYLIADKESLQKQVENQALQLTVQAPKIEVYNQFIGHEGLKNMGEVAKTLNIGRNKLFEKLRELKILQSGHNKNTPYQRYIDRGYFEVKEFVSKDIVKAQTYATVKGMIFIKNKLEVTE